MNKSFRILAAAAMIAAAASCASLDKMAQMAENVKVTCDPGVLEAVNGSIDAQVAVTYPEGYFNPKAILEVTPVIVYPGGEAKMKPFYYQGEKVKDNFKVVSANGQTVSLQAGETVLIPATIAEVKVEGTLKFLETFV